MQTEQNIVKSAFPSYAIPDISVGEFLLSKIKECIQTKPEQVALVSATVHFQFLTHQNLFYKTDNRLMPSLDRP